MNSITPIINIDSNLYKAAIEINDISIKKSEIGISLGYEDGNIPDHFSEMVDIAFSKLAEKCKIEAGFIILDIKTVDGRNDGFSINDKFLHTHSIVAGQFRNAEKVAIFVCTIGPEMETWSKYLSAGSDLPFGYIVNTVASQVTEQVTDTLHDLIGKQMSMQDLNITNRYSPGYCNWSVAEQHILFSFLPKYFCGITLTDSALMTPIKSVSGIIGIGKNVKRMDYTCDTCGVKDCTYRAILEAKKERKKNKYS